MSKLKCSIVEDLMPLYIEDLLSEETKKEIELHLDECEDCKEVYDELKKTVLEMKKTGINEEDFNRMKKTLYGDYVKEYNDVTDIARMFLADYFKGINSFDYIEQIGSISKQYAEQILDEVFDENKMVLSIVKSK